MVKVDLKAIPYCLSDEDIAWVESTIAGMSDEEKIGQLFFDNSGMGTDEDLIVSSTRLRQRWETY